MFGLGRHVRSRLGTFASSKYNRLPTVQEDFNADLDMKKLEESRKQCLFGHTGRILPLARMP